MDDNLFFPLIRRRANYSSKPGGGYYNYTHYHAEISQDCEHRCVYCDIKENEIGFEGTVLDHFRPQKHFPKLSNDPSNLVLSCPKCNRLKSDRWPADTECLDTHDGLCGFVDPFIESRLDYYSIEDDGKLIPIKPPAEYLEITLFLNRHSRKRVRYLRIIKHNLDRILNDIMAEFDVKFSDWNENIITDDEFKEFCREHKRKLSLVRSLNSAD